MLLWYWMPPLFHCTSLGGIIWLQQNIPNDNCIGSALNSSLLQWKGNNTSDVHESSYLLVVTSTSFVLILITKCFRFYLGLLDSFPLVCFSSPPYYEETEVFVFFLVDCYWQLQLLFCFLGVCYCFQSGIHVCRDFCPDRVKKNIHNKNLIHESS